MLSGLVIACLSVCLTAAAQECVIWQIGDGFKLDSGRRWLTLASVPPRLVVDSARVIHHVRARVRIG